MLRCGVLAAYSPAARPAWRRLLLRVSALPTPVSNALSPAAWCGKAWVRSLGSTRFLSSQQAQAGDSRPGPRAPLLPLEELEANRPTTLQALHQAFQSCHSMIVQATAQSGALEGADSPSRGDLEAELGWLFMDGVAVTARHLDHPPRRLSRTDMHRLQCRELGKQEAEQQLLLRLPLNELVDLWRQRVQERVPLQYLTRAAHWRDMVLAVTSGVLIPRPETELLVDFAEQAAAARPHLQSLPWVDLGTGSGCLACGLARCLRVPRVYAVDRATLPMAVARINADRLGLGERVTVLQGSWAEPLLAANFNLAGSCGGLVSNPPYIPTQDLAGLQIEVGRYEPKLALDGGSGAGLDAYSHIINAATMLLAPGGFLGLETGSKAQSQAVCDMLERERFADIEIRADLAGIQRFVVAVKR